jgi:hypothetical protein
MKFVSTLVLLTLGGVLSAAPITILDPSFEQYTLTPASGYGSYWYTPGINGPAVGSGYSPWYGGISTPGVAGQGLVGNGSAFGNPNAPDGNQAAFLQLNLSYFEQTLTGLPVGALAQFSFLAAGRSANDGPDQLAVWFDGVQVLLVTPTAGVYETYTTAQKLITHSTATLSFVGVSPAPLDTTTFVDNVSGSMVPEPSSWMLVAFGIGALRFLRKR